jgi:virginiamycin B lyase
MRDMLLKATTAAALAALLSGCSGVDSAAVPQTAAPNGTRAASATASSGHAVMTIRIPRPVKRPAYISPSTKSMSVFADGTKLGTFDLTPGSTGCKKANGGTQCSITLGVPIGPVTFKVETFSDTAGGGSMLSEGSVTQTIVKGKTAAIALTLSGIVKSIVIALGSSSTRAGTSSKTAVYVTGYDATGAAIVGPGNYTQPITLTNSDSTHATQLSTTTVNGPSTAVTLSYNGGPLVSATIGASGDGVSTVVDAIFTPTPEILRSYSIPVSVDGKPYAITAGADDSLWFTTEGHRSTNAVVRVSTDGAMTAFRGGVAGLTNDDYLGIATGSDGSEWFTEYASSKIGRITTGAARPVRQYSLPRGWCPNQIVADPSGLWFTSYCRNEIGHITVDGAIKLYPLARGGSRYTGIIVGKDGNLYIADRGNASIGQVKISGGAVTSFSEVKVGANPFDGRPNADLTGLAQTGDGTIWWTNEACSPSTLGSLVIGSPFNSSKIEQYITKVGCSDPAYMAVAPAGGQTIWLAEEKNPIIEEVAAPTGGGVPKLTDFTVQAQTPNGSAQGTAGIALGPDGNLWSTVHTSPGNLVQLVY